MENDHPWGMRTIREPESDSALLRLVTKDASSTGPIHDVIRRAVVSPMNLPQTMCLPMPLLAMCPDATTVRDSTCSEQYIDPFCCDVVEKFAPDWQLRLGVRAGKVTEEGKL